MNIARALFFGILSSMALLLSSCGGTYQSCDTNGVCQTVEIPKKQVTNSDGPISSGWMYSDNGVYAGNCTIGLPVRYYGQVGFLSASHCYGWGNLYLGSHPSNRLISYGPSLVSNDISFYPVVDSEVSNTTIGNVVYSDSSGQVTGGVTVTSLGGIPFPDSYDRFTPFGQDIIIQGAVKGVRGPTKADYYMAHFDPNTGPLVCFSFGGPWSGGDSGGPVLRAGGSNFVGTYSGVVIGLVDGNNNPIYPVCTSVVDVLLGQISLN